MNTKEEYERMSSYVLGFRKGTAVYLLKEKGLQFAVAKEDDVIHAVPAVVAILLTLKHGIVIQTELDGRVRYLGVG
jgi:hypothetical protein